MLYQQRKSLLVFLVGFFVLSGGAYGKRIGERKEVKRKLLTINVVGGTGDPPESALPLGLCEGDCDNNAECAEGLICFQRDPFEEVPGCEGGTTDESYSDYCIQDPNADPTPVPTIGVPTVAPTVEPSVSSAPSKAPSAAPSDVPTLSPFGTIEYVGNEGIFYSPYPLGICKGDCDTNEDCAEGLICHQRNGYDPVPGCDGGLNESSTADFCVWDGIGDPPGPEPTPPNGTFRLKLYWEEGYTWQNETFEREWCMMYNFDGYPGIGFDRCWRARDAIKCDPNQVFIAKCVTGEPRQWFTFIDLGNSSGVDEILIQTGDGERCFERYERDIWLEECDEENSLQRWYALNESFDGPRFEISQLGFETQLITNDHHPKSGEIVEMHHAEASRANDSQSSFWNKY